KASTSVGPSFSIHCSLSAAIVGSSTALMQSSASVWTRIRSITNRLSAANRGTSSSMPDSLSTSMLMVRACSPGVVAGRRGRVRRGAEGGAVPTRDARLPGVELVVRRHDRPDQLVPYHVMRGQPLEGDVVELAEDALHAPQAGLHAAGQVDLGDVAGDHDLRPEAQPGQEHLH